jgi:hypothetical protein
MSSDVVSATDLLSRQIETVVSTTDFPLKQIASFFFPLCRSLFIVLRRLKRVYENIPYASIQALLHLN